jgi:hypothetical protein
MLVDHADLEVECIFWLANGNKIAVNVNFSGIGEVYALEYVHECCFTAAVFTEQRENLTASQFKMDIRKSLDCTETFADVMHLNDIIDGYRFRI